MLPRAPDRDTLGGRILTVLADMQEKGLMTIEDEVEKRFGIDLDPDEVKTTCEELAGEGLLKTQDGSFFVKVSPLGSDDLGH